MSRPSRIDTATPTLTLGILPYLLGLASALVLGALQFWQQTLPPEVIDISLGNVIPNNAIEVAVNYVAGGPEALLAAFLITFLTAQSMLQRRGHPGTSLSMAGWAVFIVALAVFLFAPAWVVGWAAGPWLFNGNLFFIRVSDFLMQWLVSWAALWLALRVAGVRTGSGELRASLAPAGTAESRASTADASPAASPATAPLAYSAQDGASTAPLPVRSARGRATMVFGAFSLLCIMSGWLVIQVYLTERLAYTSGIAEAQRWMTLVAGYMLALGVFNAVGAWRGLPYPVRIRIPRLMALAVLALIAGVAVNMLVRTVLGWLLPPGTLATLVPTLLVTVMTLAIQAAAAFLLTRRWG
ncbi:hypothetical protein ACILG0_11900 [Pseudomonadota bacterium AL_CKDN230030165-1A_HGKHYDSX7]